MPNVYKPGLIQIRPQYQTGLTDQPDTPENITFWQGGNLAAFPLSHAQCLSIAGNFDSNWGNMWANAGSASHTYIGSIVTDWSSETGAEATSVGVTTPMDGDLTGQTSGQNCMLISYIGNTLPRYRGGHFRTYLPYISYGALINPYEYSISYTGAVATGWVNLAADMATVEGSVGGGYTPMAYRFRNNPEKAALYLIDGVTVQGVPATQRRRLRKVSRR